MAKKRKAAPDPVPERAASPESKPRVSVITLKGDEDWAEWFREYAEFLGLSQTTAIDIALREQSKRDGFPRPMPRRLKK